MPADEKLVRSIGVELAIKLLSGDMKDSGYYLKLLSVLAAK